MSRPEMIEGLVARHLELLRCMQADTTQDWLQIELTLAQVKALFALWQDAPATVGALAERLGIGVPATSHLVERLVQLGMVERREDDTDRRRSFLRPTAEGLRLADRLRATRQEQVRRWLTQLDDDELAAVDKALVALLRVATPGR